MGEAEVKSSGYAFYKAGFSHFSLTKIPVTSATTSFRPGEKEYGLRPKDGGKTMSGRDHRIPRTQFLLAGPTRPGAYEPPDLFYSCLDILTDECHRLVN